MLIRPATMRILAFMLCVMNPPMRIAKKYLSKWLVFIIQQLHAADNYITKHSDIENPKGYDDLTPIDRADEDKNYSEALIWALKKPSVQNIAITGPYGSGKSSVLRTFAPRAFRSNQDNNGCMYGHTTQGYNKWGFQC